MGEGLWGVALIVATGEHGDRETPRVVKRLIVFFMWLVGVLLIAQLTASVTSTQTIERLKSNIHGPGDLAGKKIATVRGTVAADYLTDQGLQMWRWHPPMKDVISCCKVMSRQWYSTRRHFSTGPRGAAMGFCGSWVQSSRRRSTVLPWQMAVRCANESTAHCSQCMRTDGTGLSTTSGFRRSSVSPVRGVRRGQPGHRVDRAAALQDFLLRVGKRALPRTKRQLPRFSRASASSAVYPVRQGDRRSRTSPASCRTGPLVVRAAASSRARDPQCGQTGPGRRRRALARHDSQKRRSDTASGSRSTSSNGSPTAIDPGASAG